MPPLFFKRSLPTIPLDASSISLDISGVAGFFGGDVAVSAMTTVHMYDARKYFGWYNTPGSYEIARRYGQVARSRFWDGLYPGVNLDPAVLFELDGIDGPAFRGIQSGTIMRTTGQPGYLFLRHCANLKSEEWTQPPGARMTAPVEVSVAHLRHVPASIDRLTKEDTLVTTGLLAFAPILASAATAAACGVFGDWICFTMIVLGMASSGLSCWVIGSGGLTFSRPEPGRGSPPGSGILDDKDHIVVLKGPTDAINAITRGRFSLEYAGSKHYHRLGVCSLLLTLQFLAQLLVVPQGTIFGQIMFLTSLGVSWMYNSYLASLDHEKLQRRMLVKKVLGRPVTRKYTLGTRTAMGVFVLLLLASDDRPHDSNFDPAGASRRPAPSHQPDPLAAARAATHARSLSEELIIMEKLGEDEGWDDFAAYLDEPSEIDTQDSLPASSPDAKALRIVLDDILPNDTPTWRFWKETLMDQLPGIVNGKRFQRVPGPKTLLTNRKILLFNLYKDVDAAVAAFNSYCRTMATMS